MQCDIGMFLSTLLVLVLPRFVLSDVDYTGRRCNLDTMSYVWMRERYERQSPPGQCGMCYCDDDKVEVCMSCPNKLTTMEDRINLLEEDCYLADENEIEAYPKCCKDTKICRYGENSKYFNEERFEEEKTLYGGTAAMMRWMRKMKKPTKPLLRYRYLKRKNGLKRRRPGKFFGGKYPKRYYAIRRSKIASLPSL
ncbi:uncharacterized protein LOC106167455 [Lingula anatina]|uniref:Uncharacterized protein LOC106167455 n=1 Tax=Lingula anatina TaxID=7574 RepID=A0A1S3IUT5_LINAN|nr:uncharacterized protein LOC106167455 [Lingula anatina]XP_013401696.1 uncharacterized protein LOC106167455 [Lingula anatina]|eukprot:XP_013401695.1 uncharacterized protein LOC106167455 [Lingula anatina]